MKTPRRAQLSRGKGTFSFVTWCRLGLQEERVIVSFPEDVEQGRDGSLTMPSPLLPSPRHHKNKQHMSGSSICSHCCWRWLFLSVTCKKTHKSISLLFSQPPQLPMTTGLPVHTMGFKNCVWLSSSTVRKVNMVVKTLHPDLDSQWRQEWHHLKDSVSVTCTYVPAHTAAGRWWT